MPPVPTTPPQIAPLRVIQRRIPGVLPLRPGSNWRAAHPTAGLLAPASRPAPGYRVTDLDVSIGPGKPIEVALGPARSGHLFFTVVNEPERDASARAGQELRVEVADVDLPATQAAPDAAFTKLPPVPVAGSRDPRRRVTSPRPFNRVRITLLPDGPNQQITDFVALDADPPPGQLINGAVELVVRRIVGNAAELVGRDGASAWVPLPLISRGMTPVRMSFRDPDSKDHLLLGWHAHAGTGSRATGLPSTEHWFKGPHDERGVSSVCSPWIEGVASWALMTRWLPHAELDRVMVDGSECDASLEPGGIARVCVRTEVTESGRVWRDDIVLPCTNRRYSVEEIERVLRHARTGCPDPDSGRCSSTCSRDALVGAKRAGGLEELMRFFDTDVFPAFHRLVPDLPPIRVGERLVCAAWDHETHGDAGLHMLQVGEVHDGRVTVTSQWTGSLRGTASLPVSMVTPISTPHANMPMSISRPFEGPALEAPPPDVGLVLSPPSKPGALTAARRTIARAAGAFELLAPLVGDPDPAVRCAGIEALRPTMLENDRAAEMMLFLLDDPDASVRRTAARIFERLPAYRESAHRTK